MIISASANEIRSGHLLKNDGIRKRVPHNDQENTINKDVRNKKGVSRAVGC